MTALAELQELLVLACQQREPATWLAERLAAGALAGCPERELLLALCADARARDAMRLTRLVVEKLRLERLVRGSAVAAAALAGAPEVFAARFRRYVDAVPAAAVFPSEEAAAFAAFVAREERDGPAA